MTTEPYDQPSDDDLRLLEYLTGNDGEHLFDHDSEIGLALRMPPDVYFAARDRLLTAGLLRVGGRPADAPSFDAAVKAHELGYQ